MKAIKLDKIPVLMYHAITPAGVMANNHVHVPFNRFYEQMQWLYSNGYKTLRPDVFLEKLDGQERVSHKQVFLTFDDGYYSQLKEATPVLEKFGFNATLFLTTDAVGKTSYKNIFPNETDCPPEDRPLNWAELRVMQNGPWDIEAHGCGHQRLAGLSEKEITHELQQSRQIIEKELQKEVGFYAYPYGSYRTYVLNKVQRQKYKAAFAVHPGMAGNRQDARRYHRIEINRNDTLQSFIRKTTTGYASGKQKFISAFRDGLFRSSRLKDAIMRLAGNRIN